MSVNRSTMRIGGDYEGIQRNVIPVYDGGYETGNVDIVIDHPVRELFISNDSTTDNLIFQVLGDSVDITLTLLPGDTLDERFIEFSRVIVTAVGAWRWYVRSGRIT